MANSLGTCEHCKHTFSYELVHNGFNDSAFAYCNSCSTTAILSGWFEAIPRSAGFVPHARISPQVEPWLQPCPCGGSFKADASPRCPHCNHALSAEAARSWIENNAPGTAKGWRWQNSWSGVYSLLIERHLVKDNWRAVAA
jgi:hypothetical protein